jgi:hypothetical protein
LVAVYREGCREMGYSRRTNMKKLMIAAALAAAVSALTSGQQAFSEDYQQALLSHHPVVVTFGNCSGHIGTTKCGEQYFLQYPGARETSAGYMCEADCGVNAEKPPAISTKRGLLSCKSSDRDRDWTWHNLVDTGLWAYSVL